MQLNKFWIIIIVVLFLFLVMDRTNALDKLLPPAKPRYQPPMLPPRPLNLLSDSMRHNLRYQHNIRYQQMD